MVLMSLIGAAVAYSAVKGACNVAEQYGKNANPELDNRQFDLNNNLNGIKIRGEQNILNIAARCGIRMQNGVLPRYGYKNCIKYVRGYLNDPKEINTFKSEWKKVSNQQQRRQAKKLAKSFDGEYHRLVNVWEGKKWDHDRSIILEFDHWYNLTLNEHKQQAMDLYDNTYFGEIAMQPPVVRKHPTIYGKRTEVWKVKATKDAKQDNWVTKNTYGGLYDTCCKYRGYNPK